MIRSIRSRLQWWYGLVYVASLVIFGSLVYWRADRETHERLSQQVVSAAQYLDVSLRNGPPRWISGPGDFPDGPPEQRPLFDGAPRSGDGPPRGAEGPPRGGEGPRFGLAPLLRDLDPRSVRQRRSDGDARDDLRSPPEPRPDRRPGDGRPADGRPGEVRAGDSRTGEGRAGERRAGEGRASEVRASEGRDSELRRVEDRPMGNRGPDGALHAPTLPPSAVQQAEGASPAGPPEATIEFAIWQQDGRLLASEGVDLVPQMRQPPAAGRDLATVVRFDRDVVQATKRGPHGTIITTLRSTQQEFDRLRRFGYQMGTIGLLLLTTGLLGGWWISGRMVQPIQRISSTASRISATHLSARIETHDLDQELIELGTVLNEAFSRLQHSFERLTQFTADASHELRTPLAVLQAQIELTLSQARTPDVYQQTLQTCLNSAQRLQSMVDGLLLLARADAERLNIVRHTFDLRLVAEDVCVQLQPQAAEAAVELDCLTPEMPVWIAGDPAFLARVPFNLIDNALQQTQPQGTVTVRVEIAEETRQAVLTVTDTGPGIAAEHIRHLFERFYRVDAGRSRTRGGSGLGLAICQSLVSAHDGQIDCQSRLGSGAVFTVRFPLVSPADDPAGSAARSIVRD